MKSKRVNDILGIILYLIVCFIIISIICLFYLILRPKFKSITLELGSDISIDNFLVSDIYKKGSSTITDLDSIDLSNVGTTNITLMYRNTQEEVTLTIVDTTAPVVEFQNITKSLDYEIDESDFIVSVFDYSEYEVALASTPEITDYGDYEVVISVTDTYGNTTTNTCILTISWINLEVTIELGEDFGYSDILYDVDKYKDLISKDQINSVDTNTVGEYTIEITYEGKTYISTINVVDTTAPTLKLKKVTIYDDVTELDYTKFIKSVSDASGDVETTLETEIVFGEIGTQEITIIARDMYGNTTTETTTLTIKKDTDGPVFSGLSDITINKNGNGNINYTKGVSCSDAHDGTTEFTVDSSNVNTSEAGTYYATYKATDKSGNTTTKKRKVIVNHDSSDTETKFNEFYNNYLAGKSPLEMAQEIRNRIKSTSAWGGDDPVWYGLTNGAGNCYVHALILQKALTKAGYSNYLIWRSDKGHYWNLVYVNGGWYHLDSTLYNNTPVALRTDEEQETIPVMKGLGWDKSLWPSVWPSE